MDQLTQHIEGLIFTAKDPISLKEIGACLKECFQTKIEKKEIEQCLEKLDEKYQSDDFAFQLVNVADGYQFLLKGSYFNTVATHLKLTARKKLSRAAMETLSILAYRQPISRTEIEKIRGVSCVYSLQKLLDKDLVEILGRSDGPGRPLLYGTSQKFMTYFGLKSISDLPKLKEFKVADTEIGEQKDIHELDTISSQN